MKKMKNEHKKDSIISYSWAPMRRPTNITHLRRKVDLGDPG